MKVSQKISDPSGSTSPRGQLSRHDIESELSRTDGLVIIPHLPSCQKAASYDLTPTIVAMSAKTGYLQKVYRESRYVNDRYYIYVGAKDTVLIISNEYLRIPPSIAGYVCSRVSKVVEGFGHISTTIDPNWSGAALIALSNPSNQLLKVYVGDVDGSGSPNPLATVTFHYLSTPCTRDDFDVRHQGMRIDLLKKVSYHQRRGIRAMLRKPFYRRRKNFTDYFFSAYESKYKDDTLSKWELFLQEFSYTHIPASAPHDGACDSALSACSQVSGATTPSHKGPSRKARLSAKDFVITENIFNQAYYWFIRHWKTITAIFFLILLLLFGLGVLSPDLVAPISSILQPLIELFC